MAGDFPENNGTHFSNEDEGPSIFSSSRKRSVKEESIRYRRLKISLVIIGFILLGMAIIPFVGWVRDLQKSYNVDSYIQQTEGNDIQKSENSSSESFLPDMKISPDKAESGLVPDSLIVSEEGTKEIPKTFNYQDGQKPADNIPSENGGNEFITPKAEYVDARDRTGKNEDSRLNMDAMVEFRTREFLSYAQSTPAPSIAELKPDVKHVTRMDPAPRKTDEKRQPRSIAKATSISSEMKVEIVTLVVSLGYNVREANGLIAAHEKKLSACGGICSVNTDFLSRNPGRSFRKAVLKSKGNLHFLYGSDEDLYLRTDNSGRVLGSLNDIGDSLYPSNGNHVKNR